MASLNMSNISKSFGATPVLDDVNLFVPSGQLVSILGESGTGKSTLLRIICGIEKPDQGTLHKNDENMTSTAAHQRRIGMVFQEALLFPHLTVLENVAFGLKMDNGNHAQNHHLAIECLEQVKMAAYKDRMPHQLSGGQKQRVSIARTLAVKPDIILLDEPFSSLDHHLRLDMCELLLSIKNELKQTLLLVTHDRTEALTISDQVAILANHKILAYGTPRDLYQKPNSLYVANYLGDVNVLSHSAQSSISLIRPELMTLYTRDVAPQLTDGEIELQGTLISQSFSGSSTTYRVSISDTLYQIKALSHKAYSADEPVILRYHSDHVFYVED